MEEQRGEGVLVRWRSKGEKRDQWTKKENRENRDRVLRMRVAKLFFFFYQ